MKPVLTPDEYKAAKAICDKAAAYMETHATVGRGGWRSLSADLAKHPDYASCSNELRGQVEQYELLTNTPAALSAYIGEANRNGMGVDRIEGQTYPVTVWTGLQIGYATRGRGWRVNSHFGTHMFPFYARINGREYYGRGFGSGMCINLRETAASKRQGGIASPIYA
jgi:hypothetical protein